MEGGWKTPSPRVSSRAKSPGLIGLAYCVILIVQKDRILVSFVLQVTVRRYAVY